MQTAYPPPPHLVSARRYAEGLSNDDKAENNKINNNKTDINGSAKD